MQMMLLKSDALEYEGEFETHLTIRAEDTRNVDAARAWAARHRLKFLHIVLERGNVPSQPMLTRRASGLVSEQMHAATELSRRLLADGIEVTRVKIEAAPWNRGVPQSDTEAVESHSGKYFEHHVKLVLEATTDIPVLARLVEGHSAHLSRNAFRQRDDGRSERFVTQRCFQVGQVASRRSLEQLLAELRTQGYAPLEIEEEFVVHDSNLAVDDGWIEKRQ
ncbi:hypothetical protein [Zavarzinella formosa]|uniref:hypothetical protein n=1 Tax=Zavarzinella formosa TaxID=360055 RepID=UPI00030F938D|nr:hypothetical protein [Zavarzinella formosa]